MLTRFTRASLRVLLSIVLAALVIGGVAAAGLSVTFADLHRNAAADRPPTQWPAPKPVVAGRTVVAVVLGTTGSVVTDVLGPYEVFARSDAFTVYTVSATRTPVNLTGGLPVLPDYSFADVTAGRVAAPDVVVVPAVAKPYGAEEASTREFVAEQAAAGARILGVCAGSMLLAEGGVLDGHRATSFWQRIDGLQKRFDRTEWVRGERYVQDGAVTTTAGVTSGIVGALRLVEQLAGRAEAERVGRAVNYPQWSVDAATTIPVNTIAPADAPYVLNALFPWARPTIGVGLVDGVGEIDVAAVFEVNAATSSAARAIPLAAEDAVRTRHGVALLPTIADDQISVDRFVVPGDASVLDARLRAWASARGLAVEATGSGFDPVLRDLAARSDRATARMTAKYIEYPLDGSVLSGAAWPWRPTVLLAATLALGVTIGVVAPMLVRMALAGLAASRQRRAQRRQRVESVRS